VDLIQKALTELDRESAALTSTASGVSNFRKLLHFSVPHHGKLWKSLMRAHLGDYEILDRRLRKHAQ